MCVQVHASACMSIYSIHNIRTLCTHTHTHTVKSQNNLGWEDTSKSYLVQLCKSPLEAGPKLLRLLCLMILSLFKWGIRFYSENEEKSFS